VVLRVGASAFYPDPARLIVRLSRIFLYAVLTASSGLAQAPAQNWFPQEIEYLGQNASSRTEFSLDRSMLVLASKADQQDESLRHVIAGIDGISVHRFRFQGVGMYDPRILSDVRRDYSSAGWQHISKAHDKYGYPRDADLWVRLDHTTIRNIALLFTTADQVNFVSVSGSISPIDLMHLAGHFGIPRMQGGVVLPAPSAMPPLGRSDDGQYSPLPPASAPGQPGSAPPDTYGQPESASPNTSAPPAASAPPSGKPSPYVDYRHPNSTQQAPTPQVDLEPKN